MAIHTEKIGLIKESLVEMVHAVEYAIIYKKTDKNTWGNNATGGILGFPASILLFSIIDCIGSVFAGNKNFKIIIDRKERYIKGTTQHIFILNSKYFNLDLSNLDLENIYNNVRSTLTHNSLLPEGYTLQIGTKNSSPFSIAINEFNFRIYFINLVPLFNITKIAVQDFIIDLDNGFIDFKSTRINKDIEKRDKKTILYYDPIKRGNVSFKVKKWIRE
jgi:hypothetical protein